MAAFSGPKGKARQQRHRNGAIPLPTSRGLFACGHFQSCGQTFPDFIPPPRGQTTSPSPSLCSRLTQRGESNSTRSDSASVGFSSPFPMRYGQTPCPQTVRPPQKARSTLHLESDLRQAPRAFDVEEECGKSRVHLILNGLLTGLKLLPLRDALSARPAPKKREREVHNAS